MRQTLWTKNFTLLTIATTFGALGGIASGFALSFLVFDETASTFASALILAVQLVPYTLIPLFVAPWMDRMPRKPFLVGGDFLNGMLYALAGGYLLFFDFSYLGYLGFSLMLSALGAFDELAYTSIYPQLIPQGMEEKGYAVSGTLYPILRVLMTPLAAVLLDTVGVAWILLLQAGLSLLAAVVESRMELVEEKWQAAAGFSLKVWWEDICEAVQYLKQEGGLRSIYIYVGMSNGVASGYTPLLVAFFRTTPGFTAGMYSLLTAAEFVGRGLGGMVQYRFQIPREKKYGFAYGVYRFYQLMDLCLLWIPYPLMLLNRAAAACLGINSATMRQAAVQRYLPQRLRVRINAFENVCVMVASALCQLVLGAMGEVMDDRLCVSLSAVFALVGCYWTVGRNRTQVEAVYQFAYET